jgi:hypothetical protein
MKGCTGGHDIINECNRTQFTGCVPTRKRAPDVSTTSSPIDHFGLRLGVSNPFTEIAPYRNAELLAHHLGHLGGLVVAAMAKPRRV